MIPVSLMFCKCGKETENGEFLDSRGRLVYFVKCPPCGFYAQVTADRWPPYYFLEDLWRSLIGKPSIRNFRNELNVFARLVGREQGEND